VGFTLTLSPKWGCDRFYQEEETKDERCSKHTSIKANTTSTNKGEGENSTLIYRITTRKVNDEKQY
jgi:hypothetical protein